MSWGVDDPGFPPSPDPAAEAERYEAERERYDEPQEPEDESPSAPPSREPPIFEDEEIPF